MDKNMSPDAAKFAPAIKALVSQFFNIADSTLRDATAATIGVSIGENGINSTTMAEFEPTSYIGTISKGLKNSDASMLTGLPAAKYLFFGGSVNDPATSTKLIDDFTAPITAELAKISDPKSDAINKYIASVRKYMHGHARPGRGLDRTDRCARTGADLSDPLRPEWRPRGDEVGL